MLGAPSRAFFGIFFNTCPRNRFQEAFTPGHAYLQNAFFNMSTRRLKSTEVRSKSLGELAYLIRTSVREQTAPDQLLAQLKWKHDHAGQTQVPFSPGEGMQCKLPYPMT
jgi:hypothetical protein